MTFNYQVFQNDPRTSQILNDGVAKIGEPQDDRAWNVLRFELQTFVCEGNYRTGMIRILHSFLDHLDRETQPAVWVSGFYGSGKSHFVRVLEYLWRDLVLPDRGNARSLVHLPNEVQELFVELTTRARQEGGLWSAAGTLQAGSKGSVRLAILEILLKSAGLPTNYAQARFVLWLREKGYETRVKATLEKQDFTFDGELSEMYVSLPLADALLATVTNFAADNREVRKILREQYPQRDDLNNDDLFSMMERVMRSQGQGKRGELPYTLIVLDELQQYLGGDPGNTPIQQIIEECCSHFGSRLLFVATGQSAITATSAIQKLQARFTVPIELSDQDVDRVIRQVALRKNPQYTEELRVFLGQQSGEIDRHLRGSRIGPKPEDQLDLVASYPLLPTRRRFWEAVLRSVDTSGTTGMLRTQLRIVMDAVKATADQRLGWVIPADFIYAQQRNGMRNVGVLSEDYDTLITRLHGSQGEETLESRLCALIFMIDRLDREGPLATDLTPTVETLTDLLIEDVTVGGGELKLQVKTALGNLTTQGTLIAIHDTYHLQTRESAEWSRAFQQRLLKLGTTNQRIESERTDVLKKLLQGELREVLSIKVGKSQVVRRGELHFTTSLPEASETAIPIWVRDGAEIDGASARREARDLGEESPIITLFIPSRDPDALREALIRYLAASDVLSEQPAPQSSGAQQAQKAMITRRNEAKVLVDRLLLAQLGGAWVIQGGGNEITDFGLVEAVRQALSFAAQRYYPQFQDGDQSGWGTAFDRAREGAEDSLKRVSFEGEPQQHPVCRSVLDLIGSEARKGDAVRRHFTAAPYGWSQDAIDTALAVLVRAGFLRAQRDGQPQSAKQLTHQQIGQTIFQREGVTISTTERMAIRKMIQDLGLHAVPNSEGEALTTALRQLSDLARAAGGDPPCPPIPDIGVIAALQSVVGNEQLKHAYDNRDQLPKLRAEWEQRQASINERLPRWRLLAELLRHARDLSGANVFIGQADAIRDQRQLLIEPDPVPPLLQAVAGVLRSALQDPFQQQNAIYAEQMTRLNDLPDWKKLDSAQRATVLSGQRLGNAPSMPAVGTDAQLLAALNSLPLAQCQTECEALPQRFAAVKVAASKLLEPQITRLRPTSATLRNQQDVDRYLDQLRDRLTRQIAAGPVFIEGE